MNEVASLISEVEASRRRVLAATSALSSDQGAFKPAPDQWSVTEVLEHLVLAETGGINFIWRAAEGFKVGAPLWTGASPNDGRTIEEVVERTWKPKEVAPESATPRMGGPVQYWVAALTACQPVLARLGSELAGLDLSAIVYPHVLSGPLDARQRLQFLRFHLDRHVRQIEALTHAAGFPPDSDRL